MKKTLYYFNTLKVLCLSIICSLPLIALGQAYGSYMFKGETVALPLPYQQVLDKQFSAYNVYEIDANAITQWVNSPNYTGKVQLKLGNQHLWNLKLYAHDIRSGDYTLQVQNKDGVKTLETPQNITFRGYETSAAEPIRLSISNNFLFGFVTFEGEEYFIEPVYDFVKDSPQNWFVVYKASHAKPLPNQFCGVQERTKYSNQYRPKNEAGYRDLVCREVQLATACDWSINQKFSGVTGANNHITAIINTIGTHYTQFEIQFVIVTQYVVNCSSCDPWTNSTDAGTLLNDFASWGGTGFTSVHDLGTLLTNRDLDGATIGLAFTPDPNNNVYGGLCADGAKYSIEQDYTSDAQGLRVVHAHEIGHNFSATHDSGNGFIMAPVANSSATDFSTASKAQINNLLTLLIAGNVPFTPNCLSVCGTCPTITGLTVASTTNTSITITYSGATNYKVRLKPTGASTWSVDVNTTATTYTFNSLSPCIQYDIEVAGKCGTTNSYGTPATLSIYASVLKILSVNRVNCNAIANTYMLDILIEHKAQLDLDFTINVNGTNYPQKYSTSPQLVTIMSLPLNGVATGTVTATDAGNTCTDSETYTIPAANNCACQNALYENFDACTQPAGWTNVATGTNTTVKWAFGLANNFNDNITNASINGTCLAYFDDDGVDTNGGEVVEMTSPAVDVSNYNSLTLEFDYNHRIDAPPVTPSVFSVEVYNGTTWVNVLTSNSNTCGVWNSCSYPHANINILPYKNENLQVRFKYDDGNAWQYYAGFDNVKVCGQAESKTTCANAPTNITVGNIGGGSANVSWTPVNSVNDYQLRYRQAGTTTWTAQNVIGNTLTLTGLQGCSSYELEIACQCGTGTGEASLRSVFSTTNCPIKAKAKVFLEGAYNSTTDLMTTYYLQNNLIPATQPYNTAPWNYTGTEIAISLPANITDWVLVELRDTTATQNLVARKAALLRNDGKILDLNGTEGVPFTGITPNVRYYIVIRHQNHVPIISATPVKLPNATEYNFTTSISTVKNSTQETLEIGVAGMFAGDVNGNGVISFDDFNNSNANWTIGKSTYNIANVNLNGGNPDNDYNFYLKNASKLAIPLLRY